VINGLLAGMKQIGYRRCICSLAAMVVVFFFGSSEELFRTASQDVLPINYHQIFFKLAIETKAVASFIPIFAVLPFSGTYIDDLKTKFARFYLVRSGYFIYYESRLCICFLVGGVVVSLGGIVAFYSSVLLYLPKEEIVAYETIIMQPPFQIIILLFMTGGTWAVMGMTLSAIMESKYIAYVSPFVIYYLLVILSERYLTNIVFLYPPNWIIPDIWPYGACGAAIFLLELTLILGVVFIFLTGKRLRRL